MIWSRERLDGMSLLGNPCCKTVVAPLFKTTWRARKKASLASRNAITQDPLPKGTPFFLFLWQTPHLCRFRAVFAVVLSLAPKMMYTFECTHVICNSIYKRNLDFLANTSVWIHAVQDGVIFVWWCPYHRNHLTGLLPFSPFLLNDHSNVRYV